MLSWCFHPRSWIRQSQSKPTRLEKGRGGALLRRVGWRRLTCFRSSYSPPALRRPPGTSGSTGARPSQAGRGCLPCRCSPPPPSPGSGSPSLSQSPELVLKKHLVKRALQGPGIGGCRQEAGSRPWEEVLASFPWVLAARELSRREGLQAGSQLISWP